jgi:hypothetical protein
MASTEVADGALIQWWHYPGVSVMPAVLRSLVGSLDYWLSPRTFSLEMLRVSLYNGGKENFDV